MTTLDFSASDINKVLNGRYHSPIQDVVGDNYVTGSRLTMVASTEYPFVCNGAVRNAKVLPAHITNIWDTTLNKATFPDFLNTPEIVANLGFEFDPAVAAAGLMTIRVYVNETVPILIKSITDDFKAIPERLNGLLTFYAGAETGFDVKNKGVIFTIESSANGEMYDPSIELYRT